MTELPNVSSSDEAAIHRSLEEMSASDDIDIGAVVEESLKDCWYGRDISLVLGVGNVRFLGGEVRDRGRKALRLMKKYSFMDAASHGSGPIRQNFPTRWGNLWNNNPYNATMERTNSGYKVTAFYNDEKLFSFKYSPDKPDVPSPVIP